jgi:hypothetical protein
MGELRVSETKRLLENNPLTRVIGGTAIVSVT